MVSGLKTISPFRVLKRWNYALRYIYPQFQLVIKWGFKQTEMHNYYYPLNRLNRDYLVNFISKIANVDSLIIEKYFSELENDLELRTEILEVWKNDEKMVDSIPAYGRRVAWYALVRVLKPARVLETGVHQGIGSKVICKALRLNSIEGFDGRYFGTDIDLNAGSLMSNLDKTVGTILYGDSINSINGLNDSIDLFISDSDHSLDYEMREYQAVKSKMQSSGIYISDNAHISSKLLEFANAEGLAFDYLNEVPKEHWYPGGGLGIAYSREDRSSNR